MYIVNIINTYKRILERFPKSYEFFKFALVGAFNTFLDFGVYIGLTRLFSFWATYYLGANFVSFAIATSSSFFLNKYFTFCNDSKEMGEQYMKFWLVALVYIIIVQIILFITTAYFGWHDILSKILATIIGLFWNFYAHKYWSFR